MFYQEGAEFSNAEEKAFAREELVYNVTEDVLLVLEDLGVSKKELSSRLGKSRSYVTQMLSGARNMTLGSLSDICFSLGVKPKVNILPESILDQVNAHWAKADSHVSYNAMRSVNVIECQNDPEWVTSRVAVSL